MTFVYRVDAFWRQCWGTPSMPFTSVLFISGNPEGNLYYKWPRERGGESVVQINRGLRYITCSTKWRPAWRECYFFCSLLPCFSAPKCRSLQLRIVHSCREAHVSVRSVAAGEQSTCVHCFRMDSCLPKEKTKSTCICSFPLLLYLKICLQHLFSSCTIAGNNCH